MKTVLFILLCVSFPCFAAPATTGKHFQDLSWPKLDSPETIISGVQILKPEDFADIYKAFLGPIYSSDFYSVIHRIEIYTGSRDASQWTVDIYLETGENIALHEPNSFYNVASETPYKTAAKRVFKELEAILKKNPKLKKFFNQHFPKHRPAYPAGG